jgi:hypothetical protein
MTRPAEYIISRVLGGELAGAGEIEEKRVVVAETAVILIYPAIPRLCGEATNTVSIKDFEKRDCPIFIVSPLVKIIGLPSMIRSSVFENSLIDLLVFQE